jgi:hypothetical protein
MERPNNEARLKVLAPNGVWDKVAWVWLRIKGVMERDGWLIEQVVSEPIVRSVPEAQRQETSVTPEAIVLQTRSGGRGADPAYDKAHEMIQNGTSWQEAFKWFCESQKIAKVDRSVRNSFKQAMDRRNKKGQRNAT